jgi:APA family basic amino acid/polyamine antiporter
MSELKRTLGLAGLTFYGIGLIIGAGIYSVIGSAAGEAGEMLWLSFLLAATGALFTGLSYAELATMFPRAGAEYVYLGQALPRWPAIPFVVGILMVVAATATATTVSLAFAGYLRQFIEVPLALAAGLLLSSATAISLVGIRFSSWVNIAFTLTEVAGLVTVIAIGLGAVEVPRLPAASELPGVMGGAALIFFVYLGFEEIANLAEEAKEPARQLPAAILISLGVTSILYVLVALVVVRLVPPAELAGTESPLADAVAARSAPAARMISGIALFATANTALITLIGASRMMYGMAKNGDLPAWLGRVLGRRGTPWIASLVLLALAMVWLPLGGLATTASLTSFASLIAFMAVNVAVIALRYRAPDRRRPFRVPLAIGRLPLLPVAAMLVSGLLLAQFERVVYVVGLGLLAGAFILHRLTLGRVGAGRKP